MQDFFLHNHVTSPTLSPSITRTDTHRYTNYIQILTNGVVKFMTKALQAGLLVKPHSLYHISAAVCGHAYEAVFTQIPGLQSISQPLGDFFPCVVAREERRLQAGILQTPFVSDKMDCQTQVWLHSTTGPQAVVALKNCTSSSFFVTFVRVVLYRRGNCSKMFSAWQLVAGVQCMKQMLEASLFYCEYRDHVCCDVKGACIRNIFPPPFSLVIWHTT